MKKTSFLNNNGIFLSNENIDSVTISNEMIKHQLNDPIVDDLKHMYSELKSRIDNSNITSTRDLFNDRSSYNLITATEKLLKDRFGIIFKFVSDDSRNFGIYVSPPSNYNVLNNDVKENYLRVKEYIDMSGTNKDVNLDRLKHIDDHDGNDVLNVWVKSLEAIESTMNLDSITVDLNKAYIKGLPKEYVLIMVGDIYNMFIDLKMTVDEMVAITMHEIGHGFTHVEYCYRTYNQTSVIVDTIKEGLHKNQSYRKTLVIAYENAYKEKLDAKDSATSISVVIKIANKYLDDSRYLNSSNHSYTDSEQLADQFAGRFGLSKDLYTALDKIMNSPYYSMWYVYTRAFIPLILMCSAYIAIMTGLLAGLSAIPILAISSLIAIFIANVIESLFTSGGTTTKLTYDENKRRLERNVNEAIRAIRMTNVDNKVKNTLIDNASSMIQLLDMVPEDKPGLIDSFFRTIMGGDKHLDAKKFEQLVEDLQENRLHLASAKLKQL